MLWAKRECPEYLLTLSQKDILVLLRGHGPCFHCDRKYGKRRSWLLPEGGYSQPAPEASSDDQPREPFGKTLPPPPSFFFASCFSLACVQPEKKPGPRRTFAVPPVGILLFLPAVWDSLKNERVESIHSRSLALCPAASANRRLTERRKKSR